MPNLPVARPTSGAPCRTLTTGVECLDLLPAARTTPRFTYDLTAEQMRRLGAPPWSIEAVFIDKDTTIRSLKRDLMLGQAFYR